MSAELDEIINYLEFSETLGSAGQPTAEQLRAVRDAGYAVVINLAHPDSPEALADEAEIVRGLGMEYIPIPVVWLKPTLQDLRQFFGAYESVKGRKVFIHCILNMRVSVFLHLYRTLVEGMDEAQSLEYVHQVWQPEGVWEEFIRQARKEYKKQ